MSARRARKVRKFTFLNSPYLDPKQLARRTEMTKRAHNISGLKSKRPLTSISVTPRIINFVSGFKSNENGIRQMILRLKSMIKFVKEKPIVAQAHYGLQTADDIMMSKQIPTVFIKNKPVWGCNALCSVVGACLKAKKISFKFVRTIDFWQIGDFGQSHTVVVFKIGKKWFVTDPFRSKDITQQIGQTLNEKISHLKSIGKWVEGKSPEDLGLHSYADFDRHNPDA